MNNFEVLTRLTKEYVQSNKNKIARSIYSECLNNIFNLRDRCSYLPENELTDYLNNLEKAFFSKVPEQVGYTVSEYLCPFWDYFYKVLVSSNKEWELSHEWVIDNAIFLFHFVWETRHSFEDGVPFPMDYSDDDTFYIYVIKRKDKDEFDFSFKRKVID